MSRIKGFRPSAAMIVSVVALIAALGSGAVAGVTISKLNKKEKGQVKRIAERKAKRLDRKIELLPGPQGETGEQGPPGPSTGPAGGDLSGSYPDPTLAPDSVGPDELADEAVTSAAVAPNSLGGDEINETSLVGFDRSALAGSFTTPPGGGATSSIGGGLSLRKSCTGSAGNIGFELQLINDSGFSRYVLTNSITDAGATQVDRTSVADGQTVTIIDIPESTTADLYHWLTVLIPQLEQTRQLIVTTKRFGANSCSGEEFRTITSG